MKKVHLRPLNAPPTDAGPVEIAELNTYDRLLLVVRSSVPIPQATIEATQRALGEIGRHCIILPPGYELEVWEMDDA